MLYYELILLCEMKRLKNRTNALSSKINYLTRIYTIYGSQLDAMQYSTVHAQTKYISIDTR